MVHLMSAGRLRYAAPGRQGAEDAGSPAPVRGRRRAAAHRGRPEEAGRRVALHARAGRGGARAHRPGGARARRRAARRDPARRPAPAPPAPPRPAGDRRDRPRLGQRDPPHGAALPVQALDGPDRRRGRAPGGGDRRRAGARASSCASSARKDDAVYRVHDRLGEPCHVCGEPLQRVDYEEHTIYYCPACQTGGKVPEGPPALRLLR